MLPWKLFNLTPRDFSGVLLRTFNRSSTITGASFALNFGEVVPQDLAAIIFQFGCVGVSGGGGRLISAQIQVRDPVNGNVSLNFENLTELGGSGSKDTVLKPAYFLAGPGSTVFLQANFSQAALANTTTLSWSGVLIPKGDAAYN